CTSTSRQRENITFAAGLRLPPTDRDSRPHASSGIAAIAVCTAAFVVSTSASNSAADRDAPASISSARPSAPPSYWSAISLRTQPSLETPYDAVAVARDVRQDMADRPPRQVGRTPYCIVVEPLNRRE